MNRTAMEIKDRLDGVLGDGRVWSDRLPDGTELPAAAIIPDIGRAPALSGDARTIAWRDLHQVSLWEVYEDESTQVKDEVLDALDGYQLPSGGRLKVTGVDRLPEDLDGVVHHAITLSTPRRR